MNDSTKTTVFLGVAAVSIAAILGLTFVKVSEKVVAPVAPVAPVLASQPNVVVQPLVVMPQADGSAPSSEVLGGLIHNVQESFDSGIAVDGTEVISGTGALTISSGASISGNVTTTSLVTDIVTAFSSSATSQVFCSIRNTTGVDRVLSDASLIYATDTNTGGGAQNFTISQSASAATGTGADLYLNQAFDVPTNGTNNLTTTSTLLTTAQAIWKAGNYVNFLTASPTSTLAGKCRITSY